MDNKSDVYGRHVAGSITVIISIVFPQAQGTAERTLFTVVGCKGRPVFPGFALNCGLTILGISDLFRGDPGHGLVHRFRAGSASDYY